MNEGFLSKFKGSSGAINGDLGRDSVSDVSLPNNQNVRISPFPLMEKKKMSLLFTLCNEKITSFNT